MVKYTLADLPGITPEQLDGNTPLQEYITDQLMKMLTQKQDLHGRRIGKAKDAIKPQDYITQRQTTPNLIGTIATRPDAKKYKNGTTFYATERTITYIAIDGHWYYYSGTQYGILSAKPSPSVLYDIGYLYYATDYSHLFRWSGIAWVRLNDTSLYIKGFQIAPTQAGWGLCDGSTYTYSKDDGTTGSVTTPNLTGTAKFVKYGSTYISSIAAAAPTISGGSLTGSATLNGSIVTPAHQHGLSSVSSTFTSSTESNGHAHGFAAATGIVLSFISALGGAFQVVTDGNAIVSDTTGNEDTVHSHDVNVNFSGNSTDSEGGDSIDTSGLSIDTSGLGISSITAGTNGTPIAVQLIPYIRL